MFIAPIRTWADGVLHATHKLIRAVFLSMMHVRGVVAMGTWKSAGSEDFVLVRGRRPGVVIDLEEHPDYERIVLTTRHGLALVQALRLDVEGPAEDVADLVS